MIKIDVHQHFWSPQLVRGLAGRDNLPFVRAESGLDVVFTANERPYAIDGSGETAAQRSALVEHDGLDTALVCLSSPLGIESLPRAQSLALLDAYHEGALALGAPFGVWGAIPLDRPSPSDVNRALAGGCVGISLPAGALADFDLLAHLDPVLAQVEEQDVALYVHPGPSRVRHAVQPASLLEPLWWQALTTYVAQMQAAWHAFATAVRPCHPELRAVFAMLAGLAPLHFERLYARGGARPRLQDANVFYDTASYGAAAIDMLARIVGPQQLLYGSDRPLVDPADLQTPDTLDWEPISQATGNAIGEGAVSTLLGREDGAGAGALTIPQR